MRKSERRDGALWIYPAHKEEIELGNRIKWKEIFNDHRLVQANWVVWWIG